MIGIVYYIEQLQRSKDRDSKYHIFRKDRQKYYESTETDEIIEFCFTFI